MLLSSWFRSPSSESRQHQNWFKHLGRGASLRTADLPIPFTRRMAHEFAQASLGLRVEYALRWAQVRGLGGSDALAHAVAKTQLGQCFHAEDFWLTVIHFFINNPGLADRDINIIVNYLAIQKFAPRFVNVGDDVVVTLGPAQPDLKMKGRTASSLLRRIAQWQKQREEDRAKPRREILTWARSAFGEYVQVDEDGTTWTIRELLDSDALVTEGQSMQHCVAGYVEPCLERTTTIWSLGIERPEGRQRVLTIELCPTTRQIPQAKMANNDEPDEPSRHHVQRWAEQEGLSLIV